MARGEGHDGGSRLSDAPVLYVHGLPGSPREAEVPLPVGVPRPATVAPRDGAFEAWLAMSGVEGPVRLVAFSLGAHAALVIAAARPDRVRDVTLVSPAAPLQLGDFLPAMAGAPVFRAALRGERTLRALTAAQAVAVRIAPEAVLRAMFASADPTERALLDRAPFVDAAVAGLRASLLARREAYLAAVMAYVRDWRDVPTRVAVPVRVVAGTADSWTPPAMTAALARALDVRPEWREGLGHYGTLHAALPDAMAHAVPRV